ncbi:MAG: hypothetical protein M0Z94_01840 [Dehalococcoidales bacterium]|nr:hypothetical protein [Dehalococcoidales bacterium]
MSDVSIPMSLPLDSDGFLRRECPKCERQFKWLHREAEPSSEIEAPAPEAYFCPYCHEPAPPDAWWTKEQLDYARALAMAEVVGPQLRRFQRSLQSLNRPGGFLRVDVTPSATPRPEALTEPDDMVRVDLPCHLEEPLKIDEAWTAEVACLVCGIRYPAELVRALPEADAEG